MAKLAVFGNLGDALIKPIVPGQKNKQTEPPPNLIGEELRLLVKLKAT